MSGMNFEFSGRIRDVSVLIRGVLLNRAGHPSELRSTRETQAKIFEEQESWPRFGMLRQRQ